MSTATITEHARAIALKAHQVADSLNIDESERAMLLGEVNATFISELHSTGYFWDPTYQEILAFQEALKANSSATDSLVDEAVQEHVELDLDESLNEYMKEPTMASQHVFNTPEFRNVISTLADDLDWSHRKMLDVLHLLTSMTRRSSSDAVINPPSKELIISLASLVA